MPQVQQFFLEGMRPEMGHVGNLARTMSQQAPQMQRTYTIRNDVNLKKNTIKLIRDDANPKHYHLEFSFDASSDCSVKVFFAACEQAASGGGVGFAPLKGAAGTQPPQARAKGLNQTFRAAAPLDTSVYAEADLRYDQNATPARYPIIICLEATGGASGGAKSAVQSQTTFATIVTSGDGLSAQPIKQKIQVGTTSYELQEIYGIEGSANAGGEGASSSAAGGGDGDGGENTRECVICMTEPRDTTVLPCRHMCMCSECAKVLRMQSEKCPICRTPIEQLLQIKISKQGDGGAPTATAQPEA